MFHIGTTHLSWISIKLLIFNTFTYWHKHWHQATEHLKPNECFVTTFLRHYGTLRITKPIRCSTFLVWESDWLAACLSSPSSGLNTHLTIGIQKRIISTSHSPLDDQKMVMFFHFVKKNCPREEIILLIKELFEMRSKRSSWQETCGLKSVRVSACFFFDTLKRTPVVCVKIENR